LRAMPRETACLSGSTIRSSKSSADPAAARVGLDAPGLVRMSGRSSCLVCQSQQVESMLTQICCASDVPQRLAATGQEQFLAAERPVPYFDVGIEVRLTVGAVIGLVIREGSHCSSSFRQRTGAP